MNAEKNVCFTVQARGKVREEVVAEKRWCRRDAVVERQVTEGWEKVCRGGRLKREKKKVRRKEE